MADTVANPLRWILVATFVLAFPLCLAHGVVSSVEVPAVGLVPLFVSAAVAALLLRLPPVGGDDEDIEGQSASEADEDQSGAERAHAIYRQLTHPIIVLVFDTILAASLMIALVFTWIAHSSSPSLSMLAAYATIPMLTSFFVHIYLAIDGIYQWVVWRVVPPNCPDCNSRLRPDWPEFQPFNGLFRQSQAPVLVDESERYRDDPEDDEPSASTPQPEAVEVRRKDRKGKSNTAVSDESAPWAS